MKCEKQKTQRLYVSNAFSLSMLHRDKSYNPPIPISRPNEEITCAIKNGREIVSVIGHEDTAALFSKILDYPLPVNRVSVKIDPETDWMLVGQYVGPRLPQGATELPEGATIEWWLI